MSESPDGSFLRRWSRLKQGEAEPAPELPADEASAVAQDLAGKGNGEAVRAEEPPLTDADMPPIDSLGDDSDFSQFLSQGVSDGLRKRALRKLFALPEFNIRDGLNDYDDDFTQFVPLGDTVTYQMKQWLEREAEAAKLAAADEGAATSDVKLGPAEDTVGGDGAEGGGQRDSAEPVEPPVDEDEALGEADG